MTIGRPLRFEAPVDPALLRALPEIQGIFVAWADAWNYPAGRPRPIEVRAAASRSDSGTSGGAVAAFFSAGVDSFSTVLAHPEITHLIFIAGLDIAVDDRRLIEVVEPRLAATAKALGKTLVVVETNQRDLGDRYVPWEGYFGALLAAVSRLLAPMLSRVYIASETPYRASYRRGSHPLIDHLWGGGGLEIFHDGAAFNRVEKLARIAGNEVAATTLRVCWENRGNAYNCARCEKCMRTMVALQALGALDRFETFPQSVDLEALAAITPTKEIECAFWEENLDLVRASSSDRTLIAATEACLNRGRLALAAGEEKAPDARIRELEELLEERDLQLVRLQRSRSWRLTAPLRGLRRHSGSWFGGARQR
jgi:hypothetical protein